MSKPNAGDVESQKQKMEHPVQIETDLETVDRITKNIQRATIKLCMAYLHLGHGQDVTAERMGRYVARVCGIELELEENKSAKKTKETKR